MNTNWCAERIGKVLATYTFYAYKFVAHPHELLTGLREVMGRRLDKKQVENSQVISFLFVILTGNTFNW